MDRYGLRRRVNEIAKETDTPRFLIGHITKDGMLAVQKYWALVDTVLQLRAIVFTYRILRNTKNRFGSTSEIGIYEW